MFYICGMVCSTKQENGSLHSRAMVLLRFGQPARVDWGKQGVFVSQGCVMGMCGLNENFSSGSACLLQTVSFYCEPVILVQCSRNYIILLFHC